MIYLAFQIGEDHDGACGGSVWDEWEDRRLKLCLRTKSD